MWVLENKYVSTYILCLEIMNALEIVLFITVSYNERYINYLRHEQTVRSVNLTS